MVEAERAKQRFVESRGAERVALFQGLMYVATGLWPLLHLPSFMAVTGPKTDTWLVKTVGVLITVIGAVLVMAGGRRATTPEVAVLAGGSAGALAGIDVVYSARGRISKVYLLDAFVEAPLALYWCSRLRASKGGAGAS